MVGFRSIGESELRFLVDSDNPLYGRYKYSELEECGCKLPYGVVSFFLEDIKWHDNSHLFDIKVNIPDDVHVGISTYHVSKKFSDTKIFTGRYGSVECEIEEAFVRCYTADDIIEINLHNRYTDTFVKNTIMPFCESHDIKLIR